MGSEDKEKKGEEKASERSHYDVLSSAIVGTAATMLTLIATLGTSNQYILTHLFLRQILVVELGALLFSIGMGMFSLIRFKGTAKEYMSVLAGLGLIVAVVLLAYVSAIILLE